MLVLAFESTRINVLNTAYSTFDHCFSIDSILMINVDVWIPYHLACFFHATRLSHHPIKMRLHIRLCYEFMLVLHIAFLLEETLYFPSFKSRSVRGKSSSSSLLTSSYYHGHTKYTPSDWSRSILNHWINWIDGTEMFFVMALFGVFPKVVGKPLQF